MSPDQGAATPAQATVQQMDKTLAHMAAQLQTDSMTPEQTKQMNEMVEQMASMVHKLSGMLDAGPTVTVRQSGETRGTDRP